MDVSVIIPVYNSAKSIERCLNSVLNQTSDASFQIITVNDGSTDNSIDIIRDLIARENINNIEIIDKPNGGVSSARNAGMLAAKGEWIALLDSDDEWLPEKIERQLEVLRKNPDIDFLGCNVTSWSASILGKRKDRLSKIKLWEQFISWYPSTPTVIFRREIINDVGLYNESLSHAEDGEFLLRVLMTKNCWFMPDRLVEIGGGKPAFGHSGLSANLKAMKDGQIVILKYALGEGEINRAQYGVFYIYCLIKHLRRVIITKLR